MGRTLFALILLSIFLDVSCIDRETIAGTGKDAPESMVGAGGDLQSGTVRVTLPVPLRVRILSAEGRPVRGVVVEFTNPPGRVSFSDTTVSSDGDGYASTIATLGNIADTNKVYATVYGLKGSPVVFTLVSRASFESQAVKIGGDIQTGTVGVPLAQPLRIRVYDPYDNPVKNVVAVFSTLNGSFATNFVQTDSTGTALLVWTLDTLIGAKSASVTFPSLPGVTLAFTATANASAPTSMVVSGTDSIHAMEGLPLPGGLNVKMTDRYGNPAKNQNVRFSIGKGSPSIDVNRDFKTGADGIASAPITPGVGDPLCRVSAYSPQYPIPSVPFVITQYIYSQLDTIESAGGKVHLAWSKNLNSGFVNYTIERCLSSDFDNTTVVLKTITDQNVTSFDDATAAGGSSPFYRIRFQYWHNFYFYSNLRQVTVVP